MTGEMFRPGELIIGDHNWQDHVDPTVGGERKSRGLVPRDYARHPVGHYSAAPPMRALNIPLIPRSEWPDRIRAQIAAKSRTSDIRRRSGPNGGAIPSLDQDGVGYCWCHSPTGAVMLRRAIAGFPHVRLSAFFVGCKVKDYKDEGGWGALALDFIQKNGIPSVDLWPEKAMKRSLDTPECRANALLHVVTEGWADLEQGEYDRNMSEDQAMTLLLSNVPVVGDYNWWGHSVCMMDAVMNEKPTEAFMRGGLKALPDLGSLDLTNEADLAVYADTFGKRGWNSWTDGYGNLGEFTITGRKALTDGAVAPLVAA